MTSGRRPECIPYIKPHLGGDPLHNQCADKVPQNEFPGKDVLVNGKHFDALQIRRDLARACGFTFRVGVRSAMHKAELESAHPDLRGLIVVMDWC